MMPYDYWLVGGTFLLMIGMLQYFANATGEMSVKMPVLLLLIGGGCLYYAYELSDQTLQAEDLPDSFYRVFGQFIDKPE